MPPSRSRQSLPLTVLALLFVAGAILYTSISVYYYSRPLTSHAFVGIDYDPDVETRAIVIKRVVPGGPAEEAGLRAKDVVTAVNGRPLDTLNPLYDAVFRGLSGDTVRFTVRRGGEAAPIELRATLRSRPPQDEPGLPQRIAQTVMRFYPVPATLVGLAVLLLRRGERHAWLLALLFSGLATGALTELEPLIHPALRGFALGYARTGGAVARRVEGRIDRAFFRRAYDARLVLEHLAQEARAATSRDQLASLLETEIVDAFHPRQTAIYLRVQGGGLELARGPGGIVPALAPDLPLLETLARHAQPWSVPDAPGAERELAAPLGALEPECFVPLLSRRADTIGLLVLGPRLSEEPYSRDDKKLLASVAGHAGLALESLMLAEEMAERIDAERRAAHELTIAGEVQRRLLPQKAASLATVDYAGGCRQARAVGGDYYDFLDLGPGQLGLVLGDVSGKGLYAALLMVNLQANLRSLSARAAADLASVLESVNRSFCESTAGNHYATLFVGHYDDGTRSFRYVNCGHWPPFLLRASGEVERLEITAGAVGMFEPWTCEVRELKLRPGDLLVIFSDGVTEAMNEGGEEFGEAGLLAALQAHRDAPASTVLDGVMAAVLDFSRREQHDDLTLVIARGR